MMTPEYLKVLNWWLSFIKLLTNLSHNQLISSTRFTWETINQQENQVAVREDVQKVKTKAYCAQVVTRNGQWRNTQSLSHHYIYLVPFSINWWSNDCHNKHHPTVKLIGGWCSRLNTTQVSLSSYLSQCPLIQWLTEHMSTNNMGVQLPSLVM